MTPADLDLAAVRAQALRIALAILGDPDDAEDAAQDAVVRALAHVADVREDSRVNAWLYTVSRRAALTTARARRRMNQRQVDVDPDATAADTHEAPDPRLAAWVRATLALLTPDERESLLRVHVGGWTYRELSRTRGQSPSAAKMQASRARARFRELFPIDLALPADYHHKDNTA